MTPYFAYLATGLFLTAGILLWWLGESKRRKASEDLHREKLRQAAALEQAELSRLPRRFRVVSDEELPDFAPHWNPEFGPDRPAA